MLFLETTLPSPLCPICPRSLPAPVVPAQALRRDAPQSDLSFGQCRGTVGPFPGHTVRSASSRQAATRAPSVGAKSSAELLDGRVGRWLGVLPGATWRLGLQGVNVVVVWPRSGAAERSGPPPRVSAHVSGS